MHLRPPLTACRAFHYRLCRESAPAAQLLGKFIGRYCIRPRPACPRTVWLINSCSSGKSRCRRCRRRRCRPQIPLRRLYTAREVAPFPVTSAARIRLPLLCPAEPLLTPPATLLQTSSSLQLRSVCHLFCCSSPLWCCCLCRKVRPADVASSAPAAPPLKHRCSWEKHSGRPDGRPG